MELIQKEEFAGKYIAIKSASDTEVIAKGLNPKKVLKDALKQDIKDPILLYVSEPETIAITY